MPINFLDLIGTIYRDRLGREELQARERESSADRALRQAMQERQFGFQGKESGLDRASREALERERLGLSRDSQQVDQLSEFSSLLGRGAENIPQADVLRLLGNRFGVPINTATLRKTAMNKSTGRGGVGSQPSLSGGDSIMDRWFRATRATSPQVTYQYPSGFPS